jgi:alpha-L-rhamnosidase
VTPTIAALGLLWGCLAANAQDGGWSAQWIREDRPPYADEEAFFGDDPAPLLRKEFDTGGRKIKRATVRVTGLGYYELYVNGKRVGDHELDPGWTVYDKRVFYSTFDVTKAMRRGRNAAGIILGNGWRNPLPLRMWNRYNPRDVLAVGLPGAIMQLDIEYADGTKASIVTDLSWKTAPSPLLRNSVYLGEVYDARLEQTGWATAGFDDSGWKSAVLADPPKGALQAQPMPPIRAGEDIAPVNITQPKSGVYIADFGINMAGRVELRCSGPAGTRITVRYGELLYPDGTLNPMTGVCGQLKNSELPEGSKQPVTAWQEDVYILRGHGREVWHPRFTFHGFRYAEITGFPGPPERRNIVAQPLHTDVPSVGEFECSNKMFNRIHEITRQTLLSNLHSVESDCPHREKFGYGGDIVAAVGMALANFDMGAFYAKVVRDFGDDVRPNGGFTETAPFVGIDSEGLGEGSGPIGWGTAHPLLLWELIRYHGDTQLAEEQYAAAMRWIALLHSKAVDGLLKNGIGDHESLVEKDTTVSGTAFYYWNVALMARVARVLGKTDDAARLDGEAAAIAKTFDEKLYDPATGRYGLGTQACQAFALYLGLAPEAHRPPALDALKADIAAQGNALTTGIFGTRFMLHALTDMGEGELAYKIADRRAFPGWGHMIEKGATTLWEHWEYSDNTFSHNHPMFGSVDEWFYKELAGIQPAPDAVGFDKIIIRPRILGGLKWAKANYQSVRGPVASAWKIRGGKLRLNVTVPTNAHAEIFVPVRADGSVDVLTTPKGERAAKPLRHENGYAVFAAGPGDWSFRTVWK